MAKLYVKMPYGTLTSIDHDTMNITSDLNIDGQIDRSKLTLIQWISDQVKSGIKSLITVIGSVENYLTNTIIPILYHKTEFSYMKSGIFDRKYDINGQILGVK